jgi:hypothetical protein
LCASSDPAAIDRSDVVLALLSTGSVEGQPEHIYRAGECWYETPGAHHLIGRNVSNTEPAKLLAVFVGDTEEKALTIPDQQGDSR